MTATRPPEADDRYSTPIEASRRGAHRARPRPATAGLPVLAGLAVIVLVLGGGYVVFRGNGSDSGSANLSAADPPGTSPSASGSAPAATKTPAASPLKAVKPSQKPAHSDQPTGGDSGQAAVNHHIKLRVLNSTATKGLAARVQSAVSAHGWNVNYTGNSKNRNLAVTKIYYGRLDTRASAQALRDDLGYGTVVRDSSVAPAGSLVVVLGSDAN